MSKKDELLTGNYDGIEEYDNALPNWWLWLFYLTIIFSVGYFAYYEFGPGLGSEALLKQSMAELDQIKLAAQKERAAQGGPVVDVVALSKDPAHVAAGAALFQAKCGVCHGQKGEGMVGPNLTDNFWIHGGSVEEVRAVIENGVLDKGMLAWKGVLKDSEIADSMAYLWSIRSTNVAGKAAEGLELK